MVSLLPAAVAPNEKSYKATSRANDLFERHLYTDAMTEYTKVLQMSTAEPDYLALIYANRSATYLKLNQYQQAYTDAVQVIDLAPHWSKVNRLHHFLLSLSLSISLRLSV